MSLNKTKIRSFIGVLKDARALIVKGWARGAYARTKDNMPIEYKSSNAACFCAMGAIFKANIKKDVLWTSEGEILTHFNDRQSTTKEHVLLMFDRSIENAKVMLSTKTEKL